MNPNKKYRPEFNIGPLIPVAILLFLFAFATFFISITAGLTVIFLGFVGYSCYSMLAYARTRNVAYLAAFFFQALLALYNLTLPEGMIPLGGGKIAGFFYFCGLIMAVWLIYLMVSQKGKWKGRNIFELIAVQLEDVVDGYTGRPKPSGKIEISKSELFGFAEFATKNLIAFPYVEDDCIVFVPVKMGDEYPFVFGLAGDYHYYSWVSIDFDGNVSASLSKKDYLAYREAYSFDQLSDSLGKLFMEFIMYHQKNEPERVMHRLRSVKVGLMA